MSHALPAPLPVHSIGHPARAPARAVEIAAMLGDSVVSVKHCLDPRGGRVARGTWAILAGGIACLVVAALVFAAALANAGGNRAAFDTWTRVEHRPAFAFRPAQLAPGFDWLAIGGLALGIAGVAAGLVRLRAQRQSPFFRVGIAPNVDLPLSLTDAPAAAFPLIAPSGDGFALTLGDGISGELIADGVATPLGQLAATPSRHAAGAVEIPIPVGARIRARAGQATLIISAIDRPRAPALAAAFDGRVARYIAGSLAVHLALWGLLQLFPPDQMIGNDDTSLTEDIGISARLTELSDPLAKPVTDGSAGDTDESTVRPPDSQAMVISAGASPAARAADPGGAARGPAQRSHDEAVADARRSGILGSDLLADGSDTARMTSDFTGGFSDGSGPFYAGGSYRGFGIDRMSSGGCGGEGCDSGGEIIGGGGGYHTIHTGPHAGDNFGIPGAGGPGLRAHHPDPPHLSDPKLTGATYDKQIVRRYIRQHIDQIAFCYDKQLLAHPGISGEIVVQFLISPSGAVQGASATGFDPEIASCVADSVAHIAFPAPGDGGVQVSYPFQFHTTGQ